MENMGVLLFVLAAAVVLVNSLPTGTSDRSSMAVTTLLSLQYRGETVVRRDQLPEEVRQVLENRQMSLPEKESEDDTPAGDGVEGSWKAAGGVAELSPAILAFLSSNDMSEKEVHSFTRRMQHLEAR